MKTETDSSPKPPTVDVGSLARGSAVPDYSLIALNNLHVLLKMALEKLHAPADIIGAHDDGDADAVLGFLEKRPNIDALADRFLAWPLPESVCSDLCVTDRSYPHRSGTNLLTVVEARQMLEYLLSSPNNQVSNARQ